VQHGPTIPVGSESLDAHERKSHAAAEVDLGAVFAEIDRMPMRRQR